mmetsp:Transcript_29982/g.69164  ORF Transcript_29982/g.69164 Transcript_29982/m.69164 type:complete len:90 (+) Transcript_29982:418-687(+)
MFYHREPRKYKILGVCQGARRLGHFWDLYGRGLFPTRLYWVGNTSTSFLGSTGSHLKQPQRKYSRTLCACKLPIYALSQQPSMSSWMFL